MANAPANGDPRREMHTEISALIGSLAKAFAMSESETVRAVERGSIAMDFGQDANGNRFVAAVFDGQTARIYTGRP